MIDNHLIIIPQNPIVIDLVMINTIKNLLIEDTIIPTPIKFPTFLVIPHRNFTVVNAPLVKTIPTLDDINHHTDHLLSHTLIVIEADRTQIIIKTLDTNINPLPTLLNILPHPLITFPLLNLNLIYLCIVKFFRPIFKIPIP